MKKRNSGSSRGAMLDLWQLPEGAGDPVGCLATTYTFHPGLFDEQCLARFLEIESEPDREDLAFLLERETRLGGVYAGVLVDHTQAGVEHSLRWDVLPVRVRAGKQHAKISLLSWTRRLRIIIASANLTEPGYRSNFEVAAAVDLGPDDADLSMLGRCRDVSSQVGRVCARSCRRPTRGSSTQSVSRPGGATGWWVAAARTRGQGAPTARLHAATAPWGLGGPRPQ